MPGRRSLVGRFYGARRYKKKQRKAVRSYKRKGDIKKTRYVRKAPVYEPKLPDRKVVSLKWSESRIMKHNGYAGYDRSTLVDINDSSTRGIQSVFDDAMGLFNGAAGLGQPVAVAGLPVEKYARDAADDNASSNKYDAAMKYVGTNFLDIKYPYGRPMNEWQMRCNNPMQPDVHGSIGKTYWSCLNLGTFKSTNESQAMLNQYSIVPRPVVHRPYMMDNFRLHYDKFCVLAVTYDVAWQALPYDTKMSTSASVRDSVLIQAKKEAGTVGGADHSADFWGIMPSHLVGQTYDQLNQRAHTGSFLKDVELIGDGLLRGVRNMNATGTTVAETFYTTVAADFHSHPDETDAWAWGGHINPLTAEVDTNLPTTWDNGKMAGLINFFHPKLEDTGGDILGASFEKLNLPPDGSRLIWSPRKNEMDPDRDILDVQVDDIIVFRTTRPGDKVDTREIEAQAKDRTSDKPLDGINSTSGNVRNVYCRVLKVHAGVFAVAQPAPTTSVVSTSAVTTRIAYEIAPLHRTQNEKWMDLRPLLCYSCIANEIALIRYKVYRSVFMSDTASGGNPAQSDAFKGPGYLAFRITNEPKMEEDDFQANNWDVARIRETQPKSVKIKTVGWNDRRVHKTRLSWSLQSQKKFRPPGFTKRRRVVPDHHHDVELTGHEKAMAKVDVGLGTGYATDTGLDDTWTSPTDVQTGMQKSIWTSGNAADGTTKYHTHSITGGAIQTSGPHADPIPDLRTDHEKISDLYSGRSEYGLPLESKEVSYEYYNPAVGQCDVMANRDFPKEERPRFFMQYMRAHTDDAFDAKQELLQPPPIRVKVTARYRIAFMKSSEKLDHKAVGGLPDSMDYDGAADPHIRQNPCGHFIATTVNDTTTLRKATKPQTVAGQEGDGYSASGERLGNDDIERGAADTNIATLNLTAAKAGLRILKYNRGDLLCETDRGWMLLPSIRTQGTFTSSFMHARMGPYYKLAWKRISNRVTNNIEPSDLDKLAYTTLSTMFLPVRSESGFSLVDFIYAGHHLEVEAKSLFIDYKRSGTESHRTFANADPASDTMDTIDTPETIPTPIKTPEKDDQTIFHRAKRMASDAYEALPDRDTACEVVNAVVNADVLPDGAVAAARAACGKRVKPYNQLIKDHLDQTQAIKQ